VELKPEGADTEVRLFEVISRTAKVLCVVTDASLCVCVCTRDVDLSVVTNAFKLLTALNTHSLLTDQLTHACACV